MPASTPSAFDGRNLDTPDEIRTLAANCRASVVHLPGLTVTRIQHDAGWRWSAHNGPAVGAAWCPSRHVGYVLSGRLGILLADGREAEFGPGFAFVIPPEHDAWTVGSEACVTLDFAEEV